MLAINNVVEFPERNWHEIRKVIEKSLEQYQDILKEDGIKHICDRMKIFYDEVLDKQFQLTLENPGITEDKFQSVTNNVYSQLSSQIRDYTSQILLDRLILEIKLYKQGISAWF